ncbi:MAG: N-acetyltransferase [Chitinophagaceae bacterium]|nr:MAG: N-acetyltransferase [Chitinophagaceae bacterium]
MDLKQYEKIEGEFITLKTVTPDDAQDIYNWRTSASGNFLNQPKNYSVESQQQWIKIRPASEINFIIYSKEKQPRKKGMISIVDIDEQNKKAEVGRLLLDAKYLNESNPYGLEALKITYGLVLNSWQFNKIHGTILSLNTGMIKLQKFLGMEEEGIQRKHLLINNEYTDLHLFCVFAPGFNKTYLPRINFLLKSFVTK